VSAALDDAQILELRKQLLDACHILAATGCVREITGNVSARLPGTDEILVRCRRRPVDPGVEFTILEDIRRIDLDATSWDVVENYELPGEYSLHAEMYKAHPEVNAVIHGHPRASLLCGVLGLPFRPVVGAYDPGMLDLALHPVPVFPRAVLIRTPELGRELAATLGASKECLLRGHGVVTVGASVPEATMRAVKLEALAELTLQIQRTGIEPHLLSDTDVAETMALWTSREATFYAWTWEFYRRKLARL
jgi:ribulose-5-phosphate 4-epimerase/fuculose-1-phosphate aldolase